MLSAILFSRPQTQFVGPTPGGVFEYEGEWNRGKKHGHGIFRMADVGQFKARILSMASSRMTQAFCVFAGLRF